MLSQDVTQMPSFPPISFISPSFTAASPAQQKNYRIEHESTPPEVLSTPSLSSVLDTAADPGSSERFTMTSPRTPYLGQNNSINLGSLLVVEEQAVSMENLPSFSPLHQSIADEMGTLEAARYLDLNHQLDLDAYTFPTLAEFPALETNFSPNEGLAAQLSLPRLRESLTSDASTHSCECSAVPSASQFTPDLEHTEILQEETLPNLVQGRPSIAAPSYQGQPRKCLAGGSIEARMNYILDAAKEAGLQNFDELVAAHYTYSPHAPATTQQDQWLGRDRRPSQFLRNSCKAAEGWCDWERRGFEEEIMRGAEDAMRQELRSFKQHPCFAEWANITRQESISDHSYDCVRCKDVRSCEIRRQVRFQVSCLVGGKGMIRIWSKLTSDSFHTCGLCSHHW
jgi:hypothetical protein